jgi:hypothetical protein
VQLEIGLEYSSGLPLDEEEEMVEEPSWVGEDTI